MKNYCKFLLLTAWGISFIQTVSAQTWTNVTNSIIHTNSNGLLVDLHLHDFLPITEATMYYNYIALFAIIVWAAFAGQSNESRYTFTTPFFAALMVFIGWLHALDPATYWGSIVFCMLLGALMYINDMNHEKYGIAGPGDKLFTITFMLICFTASMGFISSSAFNFFPNENMGATQNVMCGTAYTCDSSGNIAIDVSVTTVTSAGGLGESVVSAIMALPTIAMAIIKLMIIVLGSVLFFSVVMMAAYPVLASSPQVVAFMLIINVVIWAIYIATFYRMFSGRVTGGEI